MLTPLIAGCGGSDFFLAKITSDFASIHINPDPIGENLLVIIQRKAEDGLLHFAQKNILMVPGNLRAGLQTFEGGKVNDASQQSTYTMQHDPTSLLPELKKLLSFAYRRCHFVKRGFDVDDDFAVAHYLKELMLEVSPSVSHLPFVAEFCLMYAFRVPQDGSSIYMISCDTLSSVFPKVSSLLKAGVCSVLCLFTHNAFTTHGPALVHAVRNSPLIHILSPMVRQIREMHRRIPKRQKTTVDGMGKITVDQFSFPFDKWSTIVPRLGSISELANGLWRESIVDMATAVNMRVEKKQAKFTSLV